MSVVLEALSKAEKEKKQGIFNQYQEKKIHDIKSTYQKIIGWIIALNICIILIVFVLILNYLLNKKEKPIEVEAKPLTSIMKEDLPAVSGSLKLSDQLIIYKNYIRIPDGPEIQISGRIEDNKDIYILVGPEMYKAGDSIGEVLLTDIQLRKVKIKYKEQEYEIPTV